MRCAPRETATVALAALLCAGCGARTGVNTADASPAGMSEQCNGADDDGDGFVDEGLPLTVSADRIRVRTDEGRSGDCSRCAWALSALAPTRSGMVLVARLYDEGAPDPNILRRRLGRDGRPIAPWELSLGELSSNDWFPTIHWERGVDGVALGTSTSRAPLLTVLDADGSRVGSPTPIPLPRAVGRWSTPAITRLDDGTYVAAVDCGADVCFAKFGADGSPRDTWTLGNRGATLLRDGVLLSAPVLADDAAQLGVAAIQSSSGPAARPRLLFFLLTTEGVVVRESSAELPLPDFEFLPVETLRIVRERDGFFVLFLRRDCVAGERRGRWVARFDRSGALVSGPTNQESQWCFFGSDLSLQPRLDGGFWLSGLRSVDPMSLDDQQSFVAELDDRGATRWASDVSEPLHSLLELDDRRIFATVSTRWMSGAANPIDVVRLGCAR